MEFANKLEKLLNAKFRKLKQNMVTFLKLDSMPRNDK